MKKEIFNETFRTVDFVSNTGRLVRRYDRQEEDESKMHEEFVKMENDFESITKEELLKSPFCEMYDVIKNGEEKSITWVTWWRDGHYGKGLHYQIFDRRYL
jgi:hypothetical protein